VEVEMCTEYYALDREDKCIPKFWYGNLKERNYLEVINMDKGTELKCYQKEVEWEGVGWTHLAQNRDQWRALVNTVMSLRVP
jgi:hypothetical protein